MSNKLTIVGISGSLRKESYNTKLLHALKELMPEDMELHIVSFADLPIYNEDIDIPTVERRPKEVEIFREELAKGSGYIFALPEYNYSIPGGFKNAFDWASRGKDSPLLHKPVSLMGATMGAWGTLRMQLAFHPLFQYMNMKPVYKPEIMIASAQNKFNEKGQLIDDVAKDFIRKNLQNLKQLILESNK